MSAYNCRSTNWSAASNSDVRSKSGAKTPRTPKHFVRNAQEAPLRLAQLSECDRVLASLLPLHVIRGLSIDIVRYRSNAWMGDRVVDCARLESVCAERHRGFESPPIRPASRSRLAGLRIVCAEQDVLRSFQRRRAPVCITSSSLKAFLQKVSVTSE